jgi:hypothetical protein
MNKTKKNSERRASKIAGSPPPPHTLLAEISRAHSDVERLKHEYSEVNNDIRNHSTLRFNIFTVYLAALGGLVSIGFGFFEFKYGHPERIRLGGRLGGLLVTLLFFYYELRIQSLINHNLKVGRDLESLLGYWHISSRPSWGKLRSHYATNAFFVILILFWLVTVITMLRTIVGS